MNIGLIGAGAVGSSLIYFSHKARKEISLIAEGQRALTLRKGIKINGEKVKTKVITEKEETLDILFISVKFLVFEEILENIKYFIDENTVIVSLLNGISTEERLKEKYSNPVVHSVVRGSFLRDKKGVFFKEDQIHITIGEKDGNTEAFEKVKSFLEEINYPILISDDIIADMWSKFAINVSENLIGAALDINYGQMKNPEILEGIKLVQKEVITIGRSLGVNLSEDQIKDNIEALLGEIEDGIPSTLQDLRAGRKTEVDLFAGEMIRLGERLNRETPHSKLLYHLLKGKE